MPLAPNANETAAFKDFLKLLRDNYGRSDFLDVLSMDAGLMSLGNADATANAGLRYIFGLKGNQGELFSEAMLEMQQLATRCAPEAESAWEKRGSKTIRRQLWRSHKFRGFTNSVGCWTHLEQVWLVRQSTRDACGTIATEDRYFATSIAWDALNGSQILGCVRLHWAIENDVFGSLDVQWREDSSPWCTQGTSVWALGVLRAMAYSIDQCMRRRTCRKKRGRHTWHAPPTWRQLFEDIFDALRGYGVATETA